MGINQIPQSYWNFNNSQNGSLRIEPIEDPIEKVLLIAGI